MSTPKSYRDLEVWRKSIELAESVYRLSGRFPAEERFGLTSQVRRSAVVGRMLNGLKRSLRSKL